MNLVWKCCIQWTTNIIVFNKSYCSKVINLLSWFGNIILLMLRLTEICYKKANCSSNMLSYDKHIPSSDIFPLRLELRLVGLNFIIKWHSCFSQSFISDTQCSTFRGYKKIHKWRKWNSVVKSTVVRF